MSARQFAIVLIVLPQFAVAAEPGPDLASLVLRSLLSLLLVIAIAVVAANLLRRLQGRTGSGGQRLRLLESVSVGIKEKVVLVAVGEQQLLLGVASGSVRLLHRLEQPLTPSAESGADPGFAAVWQRLRPRA